MPSPVAGLAQVTPTAWSHQLFLTCFSRGSGGRAPKDGGLSQAGDTRARDQPERGMRVLMGLLSLSLQAVPGASLLSFAPRETLCGSGSHGSSSRPVVQARLTTAHQAPCPVVRPHPHGASCSPPCLAQPAQASPEPPPWPSLCVGHLPPELHPHNCLLKPHPIPRAPPPLHPHTQALPAWFTAACHFRPS